MQKIFIMYAAIIGLFATSVYAQNKYVGAKVCASCHNSEKQGKVYDHWLQTNHPKAVNTLRIASESKARKIQDFELWIVKMGRGEKYGLPKPAAEYEHCLPCHSTAFGVPAQLVAPSFDPKDGVQCELCHGAGSAHAELESIKSSGKPIPPDEIARVLQVAKAPGLKLFPNENEIRSFCARCHDGMCGDFDFPKMWPKIKHSVPKTKQIHE